MDGNGKLRFLKQQLEANIASFSAKRNENKTKALWLTLGITFLSGLTTVVLGLQGVASDVTLKNIGLSLTATITVLSTWSTFFNHRDMWVRYTITYTTLRAIESELCFLESGEASIPEAKIDELFQRYSVALQETNEWWQQDRLKGVKSVGK